MGKNTGTKKRLTVPVTQSMVSFFSPSGTRLEKAMEDCETDKMASPEATATGELLENISQSEWHVEITEGLKKPENTILEKILMLIAFMMVQIQEIQHTLEQVVQMADMAMELGLSNQETTRQ